MERKDFTYKYDYFGYSVYYKGRCLGGAGTLRQGRRLKSNLSFYQQQAEIAISSYIKNGLPNTSDERMLLDNDNGIGSTF